MAFSTRLLSILVWPKRHCATRLSTKPSGSFTSRTEDLTRAVKPPETGLAGLPGQECSSFGPDQGTQRAYARCPLRDARTPFGSGRFFHTQSAAASTHLRAASAAPGASVSPAPREDWKIAASLWAWKYFLMWLSYSRTDDGNGRIVFARVVTPRLNPARIARSLVKATAFSCAQALRPCASGCGSCADTLSCARGGRQWRVNSSKKTRRAWVDSGRRRTSACIAVAGL
jgi:hypothetical protein